MRHEPNEELRYVVTTTRVTAKAVLRRVPVIFAINIFNETTRVTAKAVLRLNNDYFIIEDFLRPQELLLRRY